MGAFEPTTGDGGCLPLWSERAYRKMALVVRPTLVHDSIATEEMASSKLAFREFGETELMSMTLDMNQRTPPFADCEKLHPTKRTLELKLFWFVRSSLVDRWHKFVEKPATPREFLGVGNANVVF